MGASLLAFSPMRVTKKMNGELPELGIPFVGGLLASAYISEVLGLRVEELQHAARDRAQSDNLAAD